MEPSAPHPARVVMLSRGGEVDGAQRQLSYLAAGLDRSRFQPLVLLDSEGPFQSHLQQLGVDVEVTPMRYLRRFPEALSRYPDAFRVAKIARDADARLVHASDLWKSPYALFVARRLGIPSVLHMRGPLSPRDIVKHGMKQASAVIAIARRYRDDLQQAGIAPERVLEIDDAVDVDYFTGDCAGRRRFRQEWSTGTRVAVGIVGRIEPFKQIVEFIEAVAALPQDIRNAAQFLVIGQDGPSEYMQKVHETLDRLQMKDQITFTGRCADMPAVLSGLDILATLSGGSILFEAMACGTAIFTARKDERRSIHTRHNETAWCVTTDDPREIAASLGTLIADESLRKRLAEQGKNWVRTHLPVGMLVTKTEAAYDRLLHP